MPTCPLCLHENPDAAALCQHCGRFRFRAPEETNHGAEDSLTVQAGDVPSVILPRFGDPNTPQSGIITPTNTPAEMPQPASPPQPKLVVIRGTKINAEYPVYDGANYLGRTAERPADIDLSGLEPAEQVWSSRQHAVLHHIEGTLTLEDLNSLNGTFVNRARLRSGKRYQLKSGDVIQIGTVQLKVVI